MVGAVVLGADASNASVTECNFNKQILENFALIFKIWFAIGLKIGLSGLKLACFEVN